MSATCLLIALVLGAFVAPRHLEYDSKSHMHYLDSGGIGAAVWSGLCLILAAHFGNSEGPKSDVKYSELIGAPDVPEGGGVQAPNIRKCGLGKVTTVRVLKFAWLLARAILNAGFISYNFATLPRRDPVERLNQAKHIVTWVEFPFAALYTACIAGCAVFMCSPRTQAQSSALTIKFLKVLGRFSVLQSLPLANPMTMYDKFVEDRKRRGLAWAVPGALVGAFIAPVAVMSVLVKIGQVDFVTEAIYWEWGIMEYVRLAGFINNLAGLIPDQQRVKIEAILTFVTVRTEDVKLEVAYEGWMQDLMQELVNMHGLWGAIVFASLSDDDVCRLLNKRIQESEETYNPLT